MHMTASELDDAFFNRVRGVCNEYPDDEEIQLIINRLNDFTPTSHFWLNFAQSLALIEMKYGRNVRDLVCYAERRGTGF